MTSLTPDLELYSMNEKMVYPVENTLRTIIGGRAVLTSPKGEPLVVSIR